MADVRVPAAAATAAIYVSKPAIIQVSRFVFYAAIVAFFIFLLLVFVHYTVTPIFYFAASDAGIIKIPAKTDEQNAYGRNIPAHTLSANFVNLLPCGYTLSMDIFLRGTFTSTTAPRVLLYRSTEPVRVVTESTVDDLLPAFKERTNLLIWLDPIKNDLYVNAITQGPDGQKMFEPNIKAPPTLENLPIRKPFRVSVVFSQQFIEIYLNGKLEKTVVFQGRPTQITTGNFYPAPQSTLASAYLASLSYWPRTLSPQEVAAFASSPILKDDIFTSGLISARIENTAPNPTPPAGATESGCPETNAP